MRVLCVASPAVLQLPPSYRDCSLYPLAWNHFLGVHAATQQRSGEINQSEWCGVRCVLFGGRSD